MFLDFLGRGLDVTVIFYNPNIHPREEYDIRKEENKRFCAKHGVPFVDCDYDATAWFARTKGQELEPERGARCTSCFDMRMEVTAAYADAHGFDVFTTTNATSRWKDLAQVNGAGFRAAQAYPNLRYWAGDWQGDDMTRKKYEVSAHERFYKQEYCGCSYSLRDSNLFRESKGLAPCVIGGDAAGLGTRYFENPTEDAEEESQNVVDSFFAAADRDFDSERLKTRKMYADRVKNEGLGKANNW